MFPQTLRISVFSTKIIQLTPVFSYATNNWWTTNENQPIIVKSHGYTVAIYICQWHFLMNKCSILIASNLCVYASLLIGHVTNTALLSVAFLFSNAAKWEWERKGNKAPEMRKRTQLQNNTMKIQPFKPHLARNSISSK